MSMTAPQPWTPEPWIVNETDLALHNFLKAARLDKRAILREARAFPPPTRHQPKEHTP